MFGGRDRENTHTLSVLSATNQRPKPYEPPRAPADTAPARSGLRRVAKIFVAWLVGASLLSGIVLALQTGYALAPFGAEGRLAGLLAVCALRTCGAQVAASASTVALAWAVLD